MHVRHGLEWVVPVAVVVLSGLGCDPGDPGGSESSSEDAAAHARDAAAPSGSDAAAGGDAGGGGTDAFVAPGDDAGPRPMPAGIGCDLPATLGGAHAYFEELAARDDCMAAYSLRDPAQLAIPRDGGYAHSNSRPLYVTYDPAGDPDPRRQDAAKVVIPADRNSLPNQVRLPIPLSAPLTSSFLITWESWLGDELRFERAGIRNYKHFQIASGATNIWTEVRSRFSIAQDLPSAVARVDVRIYGASHSLGPGATQGGTGAMYDGVNYGSDALGPMVGDFAVAPERWTRYWASFAHVVLDGADYWAFSLWVADEDRDPTLIIDGAPIRPDARDGAWQSFWLEYNTSTSTIVPGRGELVAYARNVVMLQDPTDVPALLRRPVP